MITLIATYVLNPGHEAELQEYLREVIPATRAEPGCHTYDVNRSTDDELTLGRAPDRRAATPSYRHPWRDAHRRLLLASR